VSGPATTALRRRLRPLRPYVDAVRGSTGHVRERVRNLASMPTVVLIYHRVCELAHDPQRLAVRPDRFAAHMRALREAFEVLRFEQDWPPQRRPAVAITFDDGYADNIENALPILESAGVPATFFIATGYVGGGREFWWDELERVLLSGAAGPRRVQRLGAVELERAYDGASAGERRLLYQDLHPRLKKLSVAAREDALASLREAFPESAPARRSHRVMDVDEVVRMGASGVVTLGAHTVWHQPLASLAVEAQRDEIGRSRTMLQEWTGRPVHVFSYPFGNHDDYTPQSVALCRDFGFTRVAANFPAVVRERTDPMQVPRFLVRDWPADELLHRLRRFAGL
jgi:peptidoglycan/xylan/chitin deacetylase (PgdA/CDA1 family)